MSSPGAGHEFPPQAVSWQKRDVLLFANSIGCKADELHFLYVCCIQPSSEALCHLIVNEEYTYHRSEF